MHSVLRRFSFGNASPPALRSSACLWGCFGERLPPVSHYRNFCQSLLAGTAWRGCVFEVGVLGRCSGGSESRSFAVVGLRLQLCFIVDIINQTRVLVDGAGVTE